MNTTIQLVPHVDHPEIQIHRANAATVRAVPGEDAPACAFVFAAPNGEEIHVPSRPVLTHDASLGAQAAYAEMARARRTTIERCRKLGLRATTEL